LVSLVAIILAVGSILLAVFGVIAAVGTGAAAARGANRAAVAPPPVAVAGLPEDSRRELYPFAEETIRLATIKSGLAPDGALATDPDAIRLEFERMKTAGNGLIRDRWKVTDAEINAILDEGRLKGWSKAMPPGYEPPDFANRGQ
jgi:hypothetical protein